MRSICALVAYDGTDFAGFQYQANSLSVQQVLEEALERCTEVHSRITGSGRTDRGVHATGQVVQAEVEWKHSLADLLNAWNHHLPESVLIRQVEEAPTGFHPRFSASRRIYRYQLLQPRTEAPSPKRFPLLMRDHLIVGYRVDIARMNQAATALLGTHDFATFGQPPQGENTQRTLMRLAWHRVESTGPHGPGFPFERLICYVEANAFLRRMVRNLVGSLLAVGRGDWEPEDLHAALLAQNRSHSAPPVPPQGLYLETVIYQAYPDLFSFRRDCDKSS
jgi:tRNA pseudouridine38-40 synthase